MQSLEKNLKLFENSITEEMFAKTHGTIILRLPRTQDVTIVQRSTLCLDCTFAEPLEDIVALISLNQFETH